jgi:hypothetical protein
MGVIGETAHRFAASTSSVAPSTAGNTPRIRGLRREQESGEVWVSRLALVHTKLSAASTLISYVISFVYVLCRCGLRGAKSAAPRAARFANGVLRSASGCVVSTHQLKECLLGASKK